jgi:hypothetical protein
MSRAALAAGRRRCRIGSDVWSHRRELGSPRCGREQASAARCSLRCNDPAGSCAWGSRDRRHRSSTRRPEPGGGASAPGGAPGGPSRQPGSGSWRRLCQSGQPELGGERLHVLQWQGDPARNIAEALGLGYLPPSELSSSTRLANVLLSDIDVRGMRGRQGINLLLASALAGWRIRLREITRSPGRRLRLLAKKSLRACSHDLRLERTFANRTGAWSAAIGTSQGRAPVLRW